MNLKKTVIISLAALACAGFIAGCGSDKKDAASADPAKTKNEIKVGTTPGYSEQVVEFVAKEAEKEGLKVTIVPFSDYVTPNQALAQGDIDVNSYQHVPFLEAFNEKNGTKLVPIGNTYLAPLRLFSNKHKTLSDLPDGTGLTLPFLGRPSKLASLPVALARRLGIPLVIGRCIRLGGVRFRIDGQLLDMPRTDDVEADIRRTMSGPLIDKGINETAVKYVDADGLRVRLSTFAEAWDTLLPRLQAQLVAPATLQEMLRTAGAPARPEDIELTADAVKATFPRAMYYRSRYTVLDLAREAGWFTELVDEVFAPGGLWT